MHWNEIISDGRRWGLKYFWNNFVSHVTKWPWHYLSGVMVSLRLHPVRRWFQPPSSPVVVFAAASDPTHTAVHCQRSCVSGGWKPPLGQSATRRHLSSNAHCFLEPPQDLLFSRSFPSELLSASSSVRRAYSGLSVLYFRPL